MNTTRWKGPNHFLPRANQWAAGIILPLLLGMASGCESSQKVTTGTTGIIDADGVKIKLAPVTTNPSGGTTTATTDGFIFEHDPAGGASNVRWRGSIWVDADDDDKVDPGEIKIQEASNPPPDGSPPGGVTNPPPPTSGSFDVPTPPSGPTKVKVIIEVEYNTNGSDKDYGPTPETITIRP